MPQLAMLSYATGAPPLPPGPLHWRGSYNDLSAHAPSSFGPRRATGG
jgi:hypothetical protein